MSRFRGGLLVAAVPMTLAAAAQAKKPKSSDDLANASTPSPSAALADTGFLGRRMPMTSGIVRSNGSIQSEGPILSEGSILRESGSSTTGSAAAAAPVAVDTAR